MGEVSLTNLLASVRYREAVFGGHPRARGASCEDVGGDLSACEESPTFEIREWRWNRKFASEEPGWFCYVVEDEDGMIGCAQGQRYSHPEVPDCSGS